MTKSEFLRTAKPLSVVIAGQTMIATPKEFSTGSCGYNVNGKLNVELPDGSLVKTQISGNIIVVGSKEWADGAAAA